MREILDFISQNSHSIFITTLIIFSLLVVSNILNNNLDNNKSNELSKIVTIEALKNKCNDLPYITFDKNNYQIAKNKSDIDDFSLISFSDNSYCHNHISNPNKIDKYCKTNSQKKLCTSNSCCGWLNNLKCVGGNKEGPFFLGTPNKPLKIKSYNYMGKELNY